MDHACLTPAAFSVSLWEEVADVTSHFDKCVKSAGLVHLRVGGLMSVLLTQQLSVHLLNLDQLQQTDKLTETRHRSGSEERRLIS